MTSIRVFGFFVLIGILCGVQGNKIKNRCNSCKKGDTLMPVANEDVQKEVEEIVGKDKITGSCENCLKKCMARVETLKFAVTEALSGSRTILHADGEFEITACEGKYGNIKCNTGKKIKVKDANYGRKDKETCRVCPSYLKDTNCAAEKSLEIVQKQCDGKEQCKIESSNSVFGDPCYLTYKYLNVTYTCS